MGDPHDYDDEPEDDEYDPGEECGRWVNGRLDQLCSLAGTEWCDWECPIGTRSHARAAKKPKPLPPFNGGDSPNDH